MLKSRNIYFIGSSGAGKSTVGRCVADELKMTFFDSDKEIEERCGVDISWIFDKEGEEGFRDREKIAIYELTEELGIVLATGAGAILEPENRTRLGARGTVVYLKATVEQQLSRTEKDKTRPLLQVEPEAKKDVILALNAEREPLYEEIADYTVDTHDKNIRAIVNEIVQLVTEGDHRN